MLFRTATLALLLGVPAVAAAEELWVGGAGDPYATVQDAIAGAASGDVVTLRAGEYSGEVRTSAPGVTLRAEPGAGAVTLMANGRVLDVQHEGFAVEGLILDGGFGDGDGVRVDAGGFTMRNCEVRNVSRDCVDLRAVADVLIEDSRIHHCLNASSTGCNAAGCRADAHAVAGGPVRNVTIRNSELYAFSGDGFQADPGRDAAGWSNVIIEGCRIWSGPLEEAVGGYAAGVNPAENAIDTKTSDSRVEAAQLTIRDTVVWGFRGGLISNMAAFNLKENVDVLLDQVTVFDSEIAFRVRGQTSFRPRGAQVTVRNVVIYDVDTAVRYEDGLDRVTFQNVTFGAEIGRAFQDVSRDGPQTIDAHNVFVLGSALPEELAGVSNLLGNAASFEDSASDDYHLVSGSVAVDTGEMLAEVVADRDGNERPLGSAWDVGAYEYCPVDCVTPDAGVPPTGRDGGAGSDAGLADGGADGEASTGRPADGTTGGCGVGSTSPTTGLSLALCWFLRRRRVRAAR